MHDIIAEQRQKSLIADLVLSDDLFYDNGEQLASQLGVDVETAKALYDEAFESMTSGEIDAAAVAAAEKAGSEAYDNFNRTKSRLGFARSRLSPINKKIRALEAKMDKGRLTDSELRKLQDLKKRKANIYKKFSDVLKR